MVDKKLSKLIQTSSAPWIPSKIEKVQTISLNTDPNDRKGTFLIRISPGGRFPKHRHPSGEEIFMLKGGATVGVHQLKAGDFLYSPPASVHSLSTEEGCVFLRMVSEPIQIIPEGTLEEMESIQDAEVPPPSSTARTDETYFPSQRTLEPEPDE